MPRELNDVELREWIEVNRDPYSDFNLNVNHAIHMCRTISNWYYHNFPMGDFCTAMVKNDFIEAVARADDINLHQLKIYMLFLTWHIGEDYLERGNKVMSFTPNKTTHVQNVIRDKVMDSGVFFGAGTPLKLDSCYYMERPKTAPKKRIYPTVRPDLDNMEKLLLDSLQGYAFADDSQIVCTTAQKRYGSPARIVFELTEITENED